MSIPIPVTAEITDIFIGLYRTFTLSRRPEIADTLIAATALYYQLPLYTLNKKHFQFIPGIIFGLILLKTIAFAGRRDYKVIVQK